MARSGVLILRTKEKGQALLIVILIMVVALTVGLSVAARSIINLRLSTEQANSQKAFSAAEAGIEQALQNPTAVSGLAGRELNGATIKEVTVTQVGENALQVLLNDGVFIPQDQGVDIWLTKFSDDASKLYATDPGYSTRFNGNITLYWGSATDCNSQNQAALEVIIFTGTRGTPILNRYIYDPCQTRVAQNNFTYVPFTSVTTIDGKKFYYKKTITVVNGLIGRVTPLYTNTIAAVESTVQLPPQGQIISATAYASGNDQNAAYRKLIYYQSFDSVPSELFYGILTPK